MSTTESTKDPSSPRLGRVAARGLAWSLSASAIGRCASLVSQFYLGWVLSDDDFGLFAIAISISGIVATMNHGGVTRLLIQSKDYDRLIGPAAKTAITFNLLIACITALLAPIAAKFYGEPKLLWMLFVMAVAVPMTTPGALYRTRLASTHRFNRIGIISATSQVVRHASAIAFAAAGFGAMAFVLPLMCVPVVDCILGRLAAGPLPLDHANKSQPYRMRDVLKSSRWVMLSLLAGILVTRGDYLVFGTLMNTGTLGQYFFGYQLTFAMLAILTLGMQQVLLPVLSKINHDAVRQVQAVKRILMAMILVSTPVCLGFALLAGPLLHIVWGGKWDPAIPVVRMFSIALIFRLLVPIVTNTFESRGKWSVSTALTAADGIGIVIAALVCGGSNDLRYTAFVMAAYNAISSILLVFMLCKYIRLPVIELALQLGKSLAVGCATLLMIWAASHLLDTYDDWQKNLILAGTFIVTYVVLGWVILRPGAIDLIDIVMPSRTTKGLQVRGDDKC